MAGVMDKVNQLTELVGQNRMELLLFRLSGLTQRYGINVFKVREVLLYHHRRVQPFDSRLLGLQCRAHHQYELE